MNHRIRDFKEYSTPLRSGSSIHRLLYLGLMKQFPTMKIRLTKKVYPYGYTFQPILFSSTTLSLPHSASGKYLLQY
jgi:hypothetical protein